jgi:hypothetical protein
MFFASLLPNVRSIFPDYNVSKHRSSKDEAGSNEEEDETTIRGLSFCAIWGVLPSLDPAGATLSFILPLSFTPSTRDFMSVIEQLSQAFLNQNWRNSATEKSAERLVLNFVPQYGAIRMGFDNMAVTPIAKRTFDLNVFKHVRWIVSGMFDNPPRCNWS